MIPDPHHLPAADRLQWQDVRDLAPGATVLPADGEVPAGGWGPAIDRRSFLKLLGTGVAAVGLAGCMGRPRSQIVPYAQTPEGLVPGRPQRYATAMVLGGYATGLLVESHEGRPTKIEGNPDHPASLGATDAFMQAAVMDLYDPDRSQVVLHQGRIGTWDQVDAQLIELRQRLQASGGAGLRILTETVTSPTLTALLQGLLKAWPQARWVQYEPLGPDATLAGTRLAFGRGLQPLYQLDRADVILTLEADPLGSVAGSLRYARQFSDRRRVATQSGTAGMSRLYAIESTPTLTGAAADHRLSLRASQVEPVARELARRLGLAVPVGPLPGLPAGWLEGLVADLQAHHGRSLVVPGDCAAPAVHALAHALNGQLGNVGRTVTYVAPPPGAAVPQGGSLRTLAAEMAAGHVETLLILGGNPALTAPADLSFAELLGKVPQSIHLGLHQDETALRCRWHLPEAHFLEAWGDATAVDGTVSIVQPLIEPLYAGRSAIEVVAALAGHVGAAGLDLVRAHWRPQLAGDVERAWQQALQRGIVRPAATVTTPAAASLATLPPVPPTPPASELELIIRPDPTVWDGRFANNPWLQELPKPLTDLTWDNAALMGPPLARRLGVGSGDVVTLKLGGRSVEAPVWIMPGHPDGAVTVTLGYGRTAAGSVGNGRGYDAYILRTSGHPWFAPGLEVTPTGRRVELATTQAHHRLEDRAPVRVATLAAFQADPHVATAADAGVPQGSLYPPYAYPGHAWGMAIDLSACIGCNACMVACQAENNIPVVGKEQVLAGRAMHWLKVDRYHEGPPEAPATYFQPRPCMHCEQAPCELVCPVGATVHDSEGLNAMVYNRCIGTRYCSNNCPYKVRHFNFYEFTGPEPEVQQLQRNPDVTVRSRGVMEKCTYCVQRINGARIDAAIAERPLKDGDVVTACQAACPTRAITFGDLHQPGAAVAGLKASPLNYALLAELNTRPRTTYLARLRNPNPAIGGA